MKTHSDFRLSFLSGVAQWLAVLLVSGAMATHSASAATVPPQEPPATTSTVLITLPQEKPVSTHNPVSPSPRKPPENALGVGGSHGNG